MKKIRFVRTNDQEPFENGPPHNALNQFHSFDYTGLELKEWAIGYEFKNRRPNQHFIEFGYEGTLPTNLKEILSHQLGLGTSRRVYQR